MSHSAYPTANDLRTALVAADIFTEEGSTQQDLVDLDSLVGGAIETWETLTGYAPFLADASDTTRTFETDGSRCVDLHGGYVTITSVSVNGNQATENTDYRPMPLNAIADGRAFTSLKFDGYYGRFWSLLTALPGQAGQISVTGRRGRVLTLPDVAWNAILALAKIDAVGDVERLVADGTIKSWKSGTTEEEYQKDPFSSMTAAWQRVVDRALNTGGFRRARIG